MSAAKSMAPSEDFFSGMDLATGFLIRDAHGRPAHECLLIRPELSSVPAFEFALNERLWLVEKFDHPAFLTVRNIIRAPGRLTSISLVHDLTGGTRLSDVLARAASGGQPITAGATVFVLKEVLDALAELHRQSGDLAHGAIAPERIVLADGKVRIADYVLGPAIEQLRYHDRAVLERASRRGAFVGRRRPPRSPRRCRAGRAHGRRDVCRTPVARHRAPRRPRRCADEHLGAAADSQLAASRAAHGSAARVRSRRRGVAGAHRGDERERACDRLRGDLDLQQSRSLRIAPPAAPKPPVAPSRSPSPPRSRGTGCQSGRRCALRRSATCGRRTMSITRAYATQGATIASRTQADERRRSRKFLLVAAIIGLMTGAFTAAQFIPAPEWMFSQSRHARHRIEPARRQGVGQRQAAGCHAADAQGRERHPRGRAARPGQAQDLQGARDARRSRRAVRRVPRLADNRPISYN